MWAYLGLPQECCCHIPWKEKFSECSLCEMTLEPLLPCWTISVVHLPWLCPFSLFWNLVILRKKNSIKCLKEKSSLVSDALSFGYRWHERYRHLFFWSCELLFLHFISINLVLFLLRFCTIFRFMEMSNTTIPRVSGDYTDSYAAPATSALSFPFEFPLHFVPSLSLFLFYFFSFLILHPFCLDPSSSNFFPALWAFLLSPPHVSARSHTSL